MHDRGKGTRKMARGGNKGREGAGGTSTSRTPGEESGPQHIRSILNTLLRETGLEDHVRENRALLYWEEAAGEDLCRHARAAYVENGTLWVEVNNSVRMHSLQMQEADLRGRLNGVIRRSGSPTGAVRQIRFRLMTDP